MRILIADDNQLLRGAIRDLLSAEPNCEVCGETSDGRQTVQAARELRPDLVLLDLSMPGGSGFEIAGVIREELPQIKILIMTHNDAAVFLPGALKSGADGCIDKARLAAELKDAIKTFQVRALPGFSEFNLQPLKT